MSKHGTCSLQLSTLLQSGSRADHDKSMPSLKVGNSFHRWFRGVIHSHPEWQVNCKLQIQSPTPEKLFRDRPSATTKERRWSRLLSLILGRTTSYSLWNFLQTLSIAIEGCRPTPSRKVSTIFRSFQSTRFVISAGISILPWLRRTTANFASVSWSARSCSAGSGFSLE